MKLYHLKLFAAVALIERIDTCPSNAGWDVVFMPSFAEEVPSRHHVEAYSVQIG